MPIMGRSTSSPKMFLSFVITGATQTVSRVPSRSITSSIFSPGAFPCMVREMSSHDSTGDPWMETTRSPAARPAASAGEPSITLPTTGGMVGTPVQPMTM